VTLLSIFACDNIAVPLSSGFPASELRYILENSEAIILVSSEKFKDKAEETLKEGLEHLSDKPSLTIIEKRRQGLGRDDVHLVPLPMDKGGMMLYTSGTTSRPVRTLTHCTLCQAHVLPEGRRTANKHSYSSSRLASQSLGVHG
jgi:malonyl-CoA/methylmalonyl-CoA synthetase